MTCYKYGEHSRLIYRPEHHRDPKSSGCRSFAWADYRDLLVDAHRRLGGPIVSVRDNLNMHRDARLRTFVDTHDRIRCYRLPLYAPDLNPLESVRSLLRRSSQDNTTFNDSTPLLHALRHGLRRMQDCHILIDGCLTTTGLTLATSHRRTR
ncbi:transposase [Nocardia brevicatena]|uniref:transposase n=1 Tax=Nocardia brevicatena TaxID=37327 RepID=UPI001C3F3989|nr:transposase [Nocardia brevicatena]